MNQNQITESESTQDIWINTQTLILVYISVTFT